jgi:hypothetical protein
VIWGGAVLVAAVVLFGYREITQPSPKESFERALAAYRQHDLGSFKTYVDLQSILGDAIDQAASDGTGSQDLGTKIFAQAVVAVVKQTLLPMYTPALEQMVVQGTLPEDLKPNDGDPSAALFVTFISEALRAAVNTTYQGVAASRSVGELRLLDVRVSQSAQATPVIVTFKLRSSGDHYQVVGVQNLAGVLKQLGAA